MTVAGRHPVAGGVAELLADADRRGSWMLLVNGTPQSHVDLDDPTYLDFEYVRRIGHVIDLAAAPGTPLDVLHLGAGALTLARYLGATRPGSRQRAVEHDAALTDLVRRELPWQRDVRVRVRADDARAAVTSMRAGSADLVIGDVFAGARTPSHLTTTEYVAAVARVLRPGGSYAVNIGDGPPLRFTRAQLATLRTAFARVAVLADPAVLRGRRFGNLVLLAADGELPVADLIRRCARDPWPARVLDPAAAAAFAGQAVPVTDAAAVDSPAPPAGLFS